MNTPTPWAHLPNAEHIDTVLEFVKTHAEHPAWDVAWNAAWNAARFAALDAARDAAQAAARDAARNAAWNAARNAARDAVFALVAWDSAGALLNRPLTDVQALAALDEPAAVLLLAYMTARENITP